MCCFDPLLSNSLHRKNSLDSDFFLFITCFQLIWDEAAINDRLTDIILRQEISGQRGSMSPTCWLVAADQSVTPLLSRVIIQDYLLLCFSSAGNDVTCYGSADGDRQWLCPITLPDGADPHDTVIIPSPISCGRELLVRRDWGEITPKTFICIMTIMCVHAFLSQFLKIGNSKKLLPLIG